MYLTLDASDHAGAPVRLAAAGISGGATYDGLIALTALEHDLELLSRDRRAARTYRALGARFQLVA
jgi:toxin FitB